MWSCLALNADTTKHAFATDAVQRGVPMEQVQKFLGDADRKSTERYARLAAWASYPCCEVVAKWSPLALAVKNTA